MITRAAAAWSICLGALGVFWLLGGDAFPFGPSDRAARMGAVLVGLPPRPTGAAMAVTGFLATLLALRRGHQRHRPGAAAALGLGAVLLLLVPDGRLLLAVGELLVLHPERVEPSVAHQAFCTAGGVIWLVAGWRGVPHTSTGGDIGRGITYLAAALPLLYAVPRVLWALGWRVGLDAATTRMVSTPTGRKRELVFAAAAVAGGLLTLGLTQRWGTVLAGRSVPVLLATVPAGVVAVLLIGAGTTMCRALLLPGTSDGPAFSVENWAAWLGNLAWLPWGVSLALATRAYRRRRLATLRRTC